MKNLWIIVPAALMISIASCSKKEEAVQKAAETTSNSAQQTNQTAQSTATASGKTPGVAIPAKTLASMLPDVPGYTKKGAPETMEMELSKYTFATQVYMNGNKEINIGYFDYNYINSLSLVYTSLMKVDMETENSSMHSGTFGGYPGWINWNKRENTGTVGAAINNRVFAIVRSEKGATVDDLKSAANAINFSGLSSVAK